MKAQVFISFSFHSDEHLRWINALVEALTRHDIDVLISRKHLHPGDEITKFIETAITEVPILIAVCSSSFTTKADARNKGVGYEMSIISNEILNGRSPTSVIPVLRDNPTKKMPTCFGSKKYIDMDKPDWHLEPLLQLVAAILRMAQPQ